MLYINLPEYWTSLTFFALTIYHKYLLTIANWAQHIGIYMYKAKFARAWLTVPKQRKLNRIHSMHPNPLGFLKENKAFLGEKTKLCRACSLHG